MQPTAISTTWAKIINISEMQGYLGWENFFIQRKFAALWYFYVFVLQKAVSMIHEAFDEEDQFRPHLG